MKSTGEVMGLDSSFERAFAKSQLGAGVRLPLSGRVFLSVRDGDKAAAVAVARRLIETGFSISATRGTAARLREAGLEADVVNKVLEGRPHCVDAIRSGEVQMVINTASGAQSVTDSFDIRRSALTHGVPHYTTIAGARAAAHAIMALKSGTLEVAPLQSYFRGSF
jgi:carbamoyl-phosphate synthase large subunit